MKFRSSYAAGTALAALIFASSVAAQAPAAAKPATAAAAQQQVPPEIDAAFKDWDADRNGSLSLQEFRNGWLVLRRAEAMQVRLREQFQKIDVNRNSAIDANEYGNLVLIKQAGKSAPALGAFDANKDQRLEFGEYIELVRTMSAPRQPTPAAKKP
jgi:hypothetical protein